MQDIDDSSYCNELFVAVGAAYYADEEEYAAAALTDWTYSTRLATTEQRYTMSCEFYAEHNSTWHFLERREPVNSGGKVLQLSMLQRIPGHLTLIPKS